MYAIATEENLTSKKYELLGMVQYLKA